MRWIAICTVVLLAGCAQHPQQQPAGLVAPEQEAPPAKSTDRYTASGTVLENVSATGPKHGPQLCVSVRTSLPPQCSGLDIINWSWDGVPHESRGGAKWGEYELTVRYDGTSLTLADKPKQRELTAQAPHAPVPVPSTPCAAPAGGWRPVDRAKATQDTFQEATRIASASPDHAGTWIDQNVKQVTEANANDPTVFILNVAYTGNLAAHEAELRKVWGGSLCVSQANRSLADLRRIAGELSSLPGFVGQSEDVKTGTLTVNVWRVEAQLQGELDRKYGPGAVTAVGVLKPVGPQ